MVVFVCGACQESLNRGKVSAHGGRCNFSYVSCLDCGEHFPGDSFQTHIKCITEQEKYTGKKDKKLDAWTEIITTALETLSQQPNKTPFNALKSIVDRVGEQVVPKIKKKFINMCNSTNQRLSDAMVDAIWNAVEAAKRDQRQAVEQRQAETKRLRLEREAANEEADLKTKRKTLKTALKQSELQVLPLAQLADDLFAGNKKTVKLVAKKFPDTFEIELNAEERRMVKLVPSKD